VHLVNDLTAAGLHLCTTGLADFAVVTVGSGIGHKVFADGRPVVGPRGRGGELGHLVVDRSQAAPRCDCGGRGHLGAIASGRAIVAAVRSMWSQHGDVSSTAEVGGAEVVAALRRGDPDVSRIVAARANILGWALAALQTGVGVDSFVLIGGFALAAGEPFRREVARGAADSCWDLGLDWNAAVIVGPDEDAPGLYGAWLLARERGWV
jgi:glucokinase